MAVRERQSPEPSCLERLAFSGRPAASPLATGGLLSLPLQLLTLLILAVPIACVSWTVTHEEVFREARDWCARKSRHSPSPAVRKFFYLFTCEYCFSHWVTIGFVALTGFRLLLTDWRGYLLAGFSLVWIANVYLSLYGRLRLDIKHERDEIAVVENELARRTRRKES